MIAFDGPEPFDSVAVILRETREGFGEELRAVAQSLRIRFVYLQAIEEGRFDDLPGHTYAVGFVRTYAEYLGLDGEDMVVRFKEEVRGLERKTELVFPTPVPEGKIPGGAVILLSLLLVALAYGGWFYLSDQGQSVAELIPEVPERLQSLLRSESSVPEPIGEPEVVLAAPGPTEDQTLAQEGPEEAEDAPPPAVEAVTQPALEQARADAGDEGGPEAGAPAGGEDPSAEVVFSQVGEPENALDTARTEVAAPSEASGLDQGAADQPVTSPGSVGTGTRPASAGATTVGSLAEVIASNGGGVRPVQAESGGQGSVSDLPPRAPDGSVTPGSTAADEIPLAPSTAQLALAPGRDSRVYGSDNQNARIVLRAKYDSWVQVRDGQDSLLLTRVLRAGDSYRVPDQAGLVLLTGNAGGLEIEVDGKTLAPLGAVGSVRRNIALDPGRLISGIDSQ